MYCGMTPEMVSPASSMQPVLGLIEEAMRDERHDREKYKNMMCMTKDEKIRKQIEFAYKDEIKHYKMFQNIVLALTGNVVEVPTPKVEHYDKFIDAVESSINGELAAVELYRKIRSLLPTTQLRDMLYEIITDEQEHATRFVYVFADLKD